MPEIREITSGLEFPEGPIAMDDGSVILTEIKRGTLTRVKPDGSKDVVAETGGGPNGAAIGPDGKCYVCNNGGFEWIEAGGLTVPHGIPDSYTNGYIQRVDLDTGACETIYTHCDDNKLCGPNDIVFDAQGGMWFSDFGKIRDRDRDVCGLYYARPDGSLVKEVVYPIQGPNGIGLAPGDATLYAAQTFEARVWKWNITGPGELERVEGEGGPLLAGPGGGVLVAGLAGYQLLDSLAVEANGNVCVATILNGGITVFAPDGSSVEHVPVPGDPIVTNICFGGTNLQTAYITVSGTGKLLAMDWPRPGLKLNYTC